MKDTIERQDIINELESWLKVEGYSEGELNIIKAVLYELQNAPSVQPEIVRCRECKHHDGIRCFRWNSTIITGFDDFCSNGERRSEDG